MPPKREQQELEREILALTDRLIENTIELSLLTGEEFEGKREEGINIVVNLATVLEEYLGSSPEHFAQVIKELARQKLPDENILTSFGSFSTQLEEVIQEGLRLYLENRPPVAEDETVEPAAIAPPETGEANAPTAGECPATCEESDGPTQDSGMDMVALASDEEAAEEEVSAAPAEALTAPAVEPAEPVVEQDGGTATSCDAISQEEIPIQATPGAATGAAVPDNWETALRMLFPDATIIKNHTVKGLAFSYYLPEYALAIDVNPLDQKETIWKEYYCRQEKIKFLPLTVQESSRLRHILRSLRLSLAQTASQNIS